MKNHVPTIGELKTKSRSELSGLFRKATEASAVTSLSVAERVAARQTVAVIKLFLKSLAKPR